MKRILLLLIVAGNSIIAQNIDEQRVSFQYEQKPLYSIDKSTPYSISIGYMEYAQKSNDSLVRYEYLMTQFEQSYNDWYLQKLKIDKSYLLDMSSWEKGRVANPALPQPIKQVYPPQPFKEELDLPILLIDVNQEVVENTIRIAGFSIGEGGLKVVYSPAGIENVKIEKKIKNSGTTKSIEYTLKYTSPYSIKAVLPRGEEEGGYIFSKSGGANSQSYKIGSFDTEYDYEYWKIDNYNQMWKTVQANALNKNLEEANRLLNDYLGYPIKNIALDIYTVKKFKGMDYSDFIKAYTLAKQGYVSISNESQKYVTAQLKKAIAIWEEAEKESYIQDRKARVNKKVTGIVYVNLARAYLWSKDFNKADYYIQKAISLGVSKYKNQAQRLQPMVDSMRKRHDANR
jgi:hypothetical protein